MNLFLLIRYATALSDGGDHGGAGSVSLENVQRLHPRVRRPARAVSLQLGGPREDPRHRALRPGAFPHARRKPQDRSAPLHRLHRSMDVDVHELLFPLHRDRFQPRPRCIGDRRQGLRLAHRLARSRLDTGRFHRQLHQAASSLPVALVHALRSQGCSGNHLLPRPSCRQEVH